MSHRPPPQAAPDPLTQALFAAASAAQRSAVRKRARRLAKSGQAARTKSNRDTPRRSPRQKLGDAGEAQALELLQAAGCRLLERQLRCPLGELDLVMRDGDTLVFVEVRYRASADYGGGAESVDRAKRRKLVRAAAGHGSSAR